MPVVPVPMECSHRTAIGPTSLLLLFSLLKARKPPSSFASQLLPEAVEVPIPLAMFTALQLASIPMKETLVCTSILETLAGRASDGKQISWGTTFPCFSFRMPLNSPT